ncbi:MAG: acyl-[Muribaculaceae bacterium]|nr:acyl-[acyl-carrier-protein]--UDP-N-acetylglucosamine O-acyltransferase [Muribaculaceae bacterium]
RETINHIQDIYRMLYMSGLNVTHAVAKIKDEIPQSEERDLIVNFITNSKRGIIRQNF